MADFLALPAADEWMSQAMARHTAGGAVVLPVMARSTLWPAGPLGMLQGLPRDGVPLARASSLDDALAEIAQELAAVLKYRGRTSDSGPRSSSPTEKVIRKLHEIFPIYIDVNIRVKLGFATLVEPAQYPQIVALLRVPGQGLVVEGPSGSGKSVAVRQALQAIGVSEARWFQCSDERALEELDRCLRDRTDGYLVIDDFHYLDQARKDAVARRIQAGQGGTKFVLIGVNEVRTSLVQGLPDLGRRLMAVQMDRQPEEKIALLITRGEEAANIEFLHRPSFVTAAAGSFFLAQNLCYFAAAAAGIKETQPGTTPIAIDARQAMAPLMNGLRGEFGRHLEDLVRTDEQSPPRGAALVLLWLLSQEGRSCYSIETARGRFPALSPAFDWLRRNLAQAIRSIDHLTRYLHHDEPSGILTCQDPRFEFYLKHLDWAQLIRDTGHAHLRIEFFGFNLEISYTPPLSTNSAAQQRTPSGLPRTLLDARRQGHLIPFAGAGVSMAVHDRQRRGQPDPRLFPSCAALLEEAATRLEQDGLDAEAMVVRGSLRRRNPSYLDAARAAQEGMGGNFNRLLVEVFDVPSERVEPETLALPRVLWELGSKLVITTNYDRVLQWACPESMRGDLRLWNVQAPAGMLEMLRDGISRPTAWHLHGHVDDVDKLILTPDGYSRLYAADSAQGEERYEAALASLRILLASRTFLFVGFSLGDEQFGDQLRWASEVFGDNAGPHYVILRESEKDAAQERLRRLGISQILHVLTVPAFGAPLLEFLRKLAAA